MNATERAKINRLYKRRDKLFADLCVINAWLSCHFEEPHELCARIAELTTRAIEEEREARRQEDMRDLKGAIG